MRSFSWIVVVIIFASLSVNGQRGIEKQADKYLKAEKYADALVLYNQLEVDPEDTKLLFNKGLANLYTNHLSEAIRNFALCHAVDSDIHETYYLTGLAFFKRGEYQNAVIFFKDYLKYCDGSEEKLRIVDLIKQCQFGYNNKFNDQIAFVENIGPSINTEFDDFKPVQSPTKHNKYYFSSNRSGSNGGLRNKSGFKDEIYGSYFADMYAAELTDGNWTPVSAFHPILHSPKHDIVQGFNPDGSIMYFMKTQDMETGEILADTFSVNDDASKYPSKLSSPIISELGDKDAQIFNNSTMLFASKRDGGYGGYDLYVTFKNEGKWAYPINLGPAINSAYDDTSPFLAKSGKRLYYCSDRIEGMGGVDIFYSEFNVSNNTWSSSQNIGIPINSPDDDRYFSISADGMSAIFSSNRDGSYGGEDLYMAYFKNQVNDQLMYTELLPFISYPGSKDSSTVVETQIEEEKPVVTPPKVDLTVKKDIVISPLYYGNDEIIVSASNITMLNNLIDYSKIYPGIKYLLTGSSTKEGLTEFDLYFSIKRAEKAATYLIENGIDEKRIFIQGLGSNFQHTKEDINNPSVLAVKNNKRIDVTIMNVPTAKLNVIQEEPSTAEFLKDPNFIRYKESSNGLSYRIQIASTKQMYKADVIKRYNNSTITRHMPEDDYTYNIGLFEAYSKARVIKNQLIREGVNDAKIVPFLDGITIQKNMIDALKEKFPDLKDYLLYE